MATVHEGIKRTPFEATFGQKPHLGLRDSKIPRSIAKTLRTQQELEDLAAAPSRRDDSPPVSGDCPSVSRPLTSPTAARQPPPGTGSPSSSPSSSPPPPPDSESPPPPPDRGSLFQPPDRESLPPSTGRGSPSPSQSPNRRSPSSQPTHHPTSGSAEPQPGPSGLQCVSCGLRVQQGDSSCRLCQKAKSAKRHRREASAAQQQQAAKMLRRSRQSRLLVGQTVRLGIPDVDRARNQPPNILVIITEVREDGYTLGGPH
ncbi:uncharacterized protein DKFZp434B061-like [Amphibalanus amphitrite]|uniref:uncharacterized protein DKFZp434B061-like n=1 Tax=Amphibalanus amphitrite TaxID=1232801 RepID=UPI001C9248F1|nr:uncharacterized protein DKFZp434B061-like [Amphibalanus amphitrite]